MNRLTRLRKQVDPLRLDRGDDDAEINQNWRRSVG